MDNIEAFVFDAYGTIFDVRSVYANCEAVFPGKGQEITTLWRSKQLEYSWLRSLMGRYEDFWRVTEDGLRYTCHFLGLNSSEGQLERILQSYYHLDVYPDVIPALEKLKERGKKRAILSNGSPSMLNTLAENTGVAGHLDSIISVDEVQRYKPDPLVYALAPARLDIPKEKIGFVSSNAWDVAGAKSFGFTVFWINRSGAPMEELAVQPDHIIGGAGQIIDV